MDFDYTQAYTALNAEDVKVGDIVFTGLTPADLYEKVEQAEYAARLIGMVTEIEPETTAGRFEVKTYTKHIVRAPFVYMLHNKGSKFYDFAKAIYEGKPVWLNVDGKVTEQKSIVFDHPANCYTLVDPCKPPVMHEKWNGLYYFRYKGFYCEIADCSGTDRYACFVDYWDDEDGAQKMDLVDWSWGSSCDLDDNYPVPEFIIKRLDNWIEKNPSKRNH